MPDSIRGRTASYARAIGVITVLSAGALGLTACGSGDDTSPTTLPTVSATTTDAPTAPPASPTPVPTETDEPIQPLGLSCDELLTLDNIYAYNPNFGVDPDYQPSSALAERAIELGGTSCGLLNQSSGATIEYAAAKVSPSTLATLKADAATTATAVPTYGTPPTVDGFFINEAGVGTAQVFSTGTTWLITSSGDFYEPGDAERLVRSMLANVPSD